MEQHDDYDKMIAGNSYVDYSTSGHIWTLDDGSELPGRVYFKNSSYDPETRTFRGITDFRKSLWRGDSIREYELTFNESLTTVSFGKISSKTMTNGVLTTREVIEIGKEPIYYISEKAARHETLFKTLDDRVYANYLLPEKPELRLMQGAMKLEDYNPAKLKNFISKSAVFMATF